MIAFEPVRAARGMFTRSLLLAALTCAALTPAIGALAADSAVVFMYHRFGETTHPATNIRIDQFEAHIKAFVKDDVNVMALPQIIATLRARKPLPERTVAITIDDAFRSVYAEAWPRLKAAGLPFTLFVATDPIDQGNPGYMGWDEIRELVKGGVTIGSQTASHPHMPSRSIARNTAEIAKSNARFQKELGEVPELLAYPFGEVSLAVRRIIVDSGFVAAFGQHSGVLHGDADFHFLPRFAMNETYGDIARFNLAANALPLRVRDVTPADPMLRPADNPPSFGFTVFGEALKAVSSLACYASGIGKAQIERLGAQRVEVRLGKPFPPGRARINCTMPAGAGKWRWFGTQFYVSRK